ncbi:MAG: hypothetical protein AAFO70_06835 [Pseudomonadota bacterium]
MRAFEPAIARFGNDDLRRIAAIETATMTTPIFHADEVHGAGTVTPHADHDTLTARPTGDDDPTLVHPANMHVMQAAAASFPQSTARVAEAGTAMRVTAKTAMMRVVANIAEGDREVAIAEAKRFGICWRAGRTSQTKSKAAGDEERFEGREHDVRLSIVAAPDHSVALSLERFCRPRPERCRNAAFIAR